jgi:hypothetical protein
MRLYKFRHNFLYDVKIFALIITVLSISCSAQPIVSQNVPYDGTTTDMKCTIPSPALIMPIASVDEFMGIVQARAQYSRSILVHVRLAAQVFDFQNSLPPVLGNTMACTYIFGPGSALIANNSAAVLQIFGARDIVVSDIAVDRYYSAYNGPLEDCQRNRTSSSSCTALLSASQNGNAANVVQVSGSDRITILRLKTEGGISFINSLSVRLLSSNVSSVGGYGVFVQGSRGDATVRNNSVSAPWGSGIALSQQLVANTFITNNVVSGCGSSCISLRRSMLTTVEFNQCINFSVVAGNSAAGFYQLNGMGWRNLGVVVRNNFFSAPLQNCFWFADYTSNVAFTSNICVTGGSRFVGGRFNRFANNLWVWSRNRTGTLGDISCINRAPNTWATCSSYLTNNVEPDLTFLTTEVWANVFPNGSRKYLPDYTGFYTDLVPQYAYNTWCSPTAGANNISCVSPNTTYALNGTTYTLPCEALPSENFFGFTIVHLSGFVPAAFRAAANCACRGSACGNFANAWPNYAIDAISIVNQINYVNVNYFKLDENTFGRNLTLTSIDLRQLRILPNSTLAVQAPKLLEIPIDSIGFDNGAFAAPATAAPMYRLPPTQQPPDIVDSPYGALPVAEPVDGPNTPPFVQPIASSTPTNSPIPYESPSASGPSRGALSGPDSVPSIGGSPLLSLAPSSGAPSNFAPLTANGHPQEAPASSPIEMISPLPNESISSNQVVIGASSAAAAIVAIVLVIIIILLVRRQKLLYADIGSIDVPKGLSSMFNIKTSEIEVRNKIGEGSFGTLPFDIQSVITMLTIFIKSTRCCLCMLLQRRNGCSKKAERTDDLCSRGRLLSRGYDYDRHQIPPGADVNSTCTPCILFMRSLFIPSQNIVQIYGLCQEPSNFSLGAYHS